MRAFPADCPHVRRIVTEGPGPDEYRTAVEEFPAYGSVLLRLAFPNLRTVIVTAAVYRGFDHELRFSEERLTQSINLPAPGRRHTLYVVFTT